MKILKISLLLALIFLLGIGLRTLAAHSVDVGTDEMIYSLIPLNILSADHISTVEQSPLYFYLTDLSYRVWGGMTAFSTRFSSILFGALTCILLFALTKELFGISGIFAAFFFAFSGYALINSTEMDMVAFFFIFLSLWFLLQFSRWKHWALWGASIAFTLALLNKILVVLFLPGLLYFTYLQVRKLPLRKVLQWSALCLLLVIVCLLPIIAYNALLYQDKGVTDYYVSNILGIGETVHKGLQSKPWAFSRLWDISQSKLQRFLTLDAFLTVLGFIGIFFAWKKHRQHTLVLLLLLTIPFLYMAGQTGSESHYLFVAAIFSIFAAVAVSQAAAFVQERWHSKHLQTGVVILMLLSTCLVLLQLPQYKQQSITLNLRDYVHAAIPDNAIVVLDPRIYNGIHAWVLNDKHYIDGPTFFQQQELISGTEQVPLFYIQCGPGSTCGWKPEDFKRITPVGEQISDIFAKNLQQVAQVKGGDHTFLISQGNYAISPQAYELIDRTHFFWFYPVGWKHPEQAVDNYSLDTAGEKLLHSLGKLVLWLTVLLALAAIPFTVWIGMRREHQQGS